LSVCVTSAKDDTQMAGPDWAGSLAGPGPNGPRRPCWPRHLHCGSVCYTGHNKSLKWWPVKQNLNKCVFISISNKWQVKTLTRLPQINIYGVLKSNTPCWNWVSTFKYLRSRSCTTLFMCPRNPFRYLITIKNKSFDSSFHTTWHWMHSNEKEISGLFQYFLALKIPQADTVMVATDNITAEHRPFNHNCQVMTQNLIRWSIRPMWICPKLHLARLSYFCRTHSQMWQTHTDRQTDRPSYIKPSVTIVSI